MTNNKVIYDNEEMAILDEVENNEWKDVLITKHDVVDYSESAIYTKSLQEKRQTTIRFAVSDLAIIKARAKKMGIGYQNLIQALVHNYAHDKTKL